MTSLKSTALVVGPRAEHLQEAFTGRWSPLPTPPVSPHCLRVSFLPPGRKRWYICVLFSHVTILFLFFGFQSSLPSGSVSPFREFTVLLPPPLWRGAQLLLTLVPPAPLPVRAGLELSGSGEESHSVHLSFPLQRTFSGLPWVWPVQSPQALVLCSKMYVKTWEEASL